MATRYSEQNYERDRGDSEERGFIERAGDQVRSWFGDEEAERRRRLDERRHEERYRASQAAHSRHEFDEVRAGDVMTHNVITIHPDELVERAARLMRECNCGALPVVDHNGRLLGMVTDRDITVRLTGRGIDARQARVYECMTDEAFVCHVNDSLVDCLRQLSRHQIRRIPIVNDQQQVIGFISQSDLARHAGTHPGRGERRALADTLCAISEPSRVAYR